MPMSFADKLWANKQLCDTVNKPVIFEFNGIQVYIYPGESCATIQTRWNNENWDEATEHMS